MDGLLIIGRSVGIAVIIAFDRTIFFLKLGLMQYITQLGPIGWVLFLGMLCNSRASTPKGKVFLIGVMYVKSVISLANELFDHLNGLVITDMHLEIEIERFQLIKMLLKH